MNRTFWRTLSASLLLIYLVVAWIWPIIGWAALGCMLAPPLLAIRKGRWWCGNACPRGSFYDLFVAPFTKARHIPAWAHTVGFRVGTLIVVMSFFTLQMVYAWGNWNAMGLVFLRMILITTLIGLTLSIFYSHRSWCSFCPMGSMSALLGKRAMPMRVEASCISCKKCAQVCPFNLEPFQAKDALFENGDCLKCGKCVAACPKKALSFP
ncbi:TPA: 4Fe-4S binding protein [Candidatus Sumerlaeota bacterium]|jgi:ferredoxin-type protein NapH|nr:4Fe-4S binding protein [Candidatus Sumerlaeota bacterium]